ncbi:unnamed protein product [Didymodactylos carnosus]|uniref:Uncharacterized protein n=1 Tax=Didymodactylos carnosus TaxID=1234261 RepID=A0A814W1E7_9BILA|nr:unnamed protein product [Didymodactylos carnosus]CAF3959738.1 unnamed protein product [Didymodactylos carnosus]
MKLYSQEPFPKQFSMLLCNEYNINRKAIKHLETFPRQILTREEEIEKCTNFFINYYLENGRFESINFWHTQLNQFFYIAKERVRHTINLICPLVKGVEDDDDMNGDRDLNTLKDSMSHNENVIGRRNRHVPERYQAV